jgi:hypothetical protein
MTREAAELHFWIEDGTAEKMNIRRIIGFAAFGSVVLTAYLCLCFILKGDNIPGAIPISLLVMTLDLIGFILMFDDRADCP